MQQYDNVVNRAAQQNNLPFHIHAGRVEMRPHSLSTGHCRLLMEKIKAHASKVAGNEKVMACIRETDHKYRIKSRGKINGKGDTCLLEDGLSLLGLAGNS